MGLVRTGQGVEGISGTGTGGVEMGRDRGSKRIVWTGQGEERIIMDGKVCRWDY